MNIEIRAPAYSPCSPAFREGGHPGRIPLTPFRMNTCRSVSKQRTLTTFRMNTYAKTGGGGYRLPPCSQPAAARQVLSLLSHPCNPCSFRRLRTLWRNGGPPNLFASRGYGLFLSQRGWYPSPCCCTKTKRPGLSLMIAQLRGVDNYETVD